MKHIKAFIAGLAFPATLLPIVYSVFYVSGLQSLRTYPLQFAPLFAPLIFGFWNVLYFMIGARCLGKNQNARLLATGACLGFLLADIGVFGLKLPGLLFGWSDARQYLPLIGAPILYALIWRYIVKYLNELAGLDDS